MSFIETTIDQIPRYLINSKIFDEISKSKNKDSVFSVPRFETNPNFSTSMNAIRMFECLNQWGVREMPEEFLEICGMNIGVTLSHAKSFPDIFEIVVRSSASYVNEQNLGIFTDFADQNFDNQSLSIPLTTSIIVCNPTIRNFLSSQDDSKTNESLFLQRKMLVFDFTYRALSILYGPYIELNNGQDSGDFGFMKQKFRLKTGEFGMLGGELGFFISRCDPQMLISFDYESNKRSNPVFTCEFLPMIVHVVRCMLVSGRYIDESFYNEESAWLRGFLLKQKNPINILRELLPKSKMLILEENNWSHLMVAGMILSCYMTPQMLFELDKLYSWSSIEEKSCENADCTPIQYVKYCCVEQMGKNI